MMTLGTQTGSLINHMMSQSNPREIVVGMPATLLMWTDRHPGTVINTFTKGKRRYVSVQEDAWKALTSMASEDQSYEFSRDPEGHVKTFRRTESGDWDEVFLNEDTGRYKKIGSGGLMLGRRGKYHDPCF